MTIETMRPNLTIAKLAEVLGLSVRQIERQLADGTFPIETVKGLGSGTKRHRRLWSPYVVEAFQRQNGREVRPGTRHFFGKARRSA